MNAWSCLRSIRFKHTVILSLPGKITNQWFVLSALSLMHMPYGTQKVNGIGRLAGSFY
jgi:hypothetical protein